MKNSNRVVIGIVLVLLALSIGTSGFMLGYANAQQAQPAAALSRPEVQPAQAQPAPTSTPEQPINGGSNTATSPQPVDSSFKTFWEAYNTLKREYYGTDVPQGKDLEYDAIQGMIFGLSDQFTSFIPASKAKLLEEDATGSFSGIGAYVQLNKARVLQISKIFSNSPAEKAGLKAGDLIIEVDGKSLVGDDLDVQVAKVRGPAGSKVTLTIVRQGEDKPFKVDVVRDKIEIKLVESKMLDNNVAYVALDSFNAANAADQLQAAVANLLSKNPKGLIFDLRGNPGGFLDQAVMVADMFLKDGVVLYERTKDGQEKTYNSTDEGIAQDIPLVVLVNGGTASASEIVAGAIQDRGRGKLIGETTFGKGAVQQVNHLSDGSQLRVTFAHWFTPNKHDIHGKGIQPDIPIASGDDPAKDPQLDRAVEYIMTGK